MKIELSPSALQQVTTTGINQIGLRPVSSATLNGLTYSVEGDILTINGTATAKTDMQKMLFNLTQNATKTLRFYLVSGTFTNGAIGIHLNEYESTGQVSFIQMAYDTTDLKSTKTIDLTDVNYVWIYATSGSVFTNAKFRIMLSDNASDTYEEYAGGQPSPNPDYPQQIHTVSGENSVKIQNKNLFNYASASDVNNTVSGTYRTYEIKGLTPNAKYFLSGVSFASALTEKYVYLLSTTSYPDNPSYLLANPNEYHNEKLFFANNEGKIYLAVYPNDTTTWNSVIQYFENAQLEEGSTSSTYVPHQEQTYPLSLGDLEYCKIGDYEDEFYKATESDTGLTAGKWYLKKNIGKKIFTGANDEGWELNQSKQYCTQFISPMITDAMNETEYSKISYTNYFTFKYGNPDDNTKNAYYWKFQKRFIIVTENTLASTVAELKTWLGSHNVIFYYRLATPTYTLLSDTLQTQLNNLAKAISYQEQTNVSQTNDDLPFVISATALKNTINQLS